MTVPLPPAPIEPLAYATSGTPARPGILTTLGVISIVLGAFQLLFNGILVMIAAGSLFRMMRQRSRPVLPHSDYLTLYGIDSGVCLLLAIALIFCGVATLTTNRWARKLNLAYGISQVVVALIFALLYRLLMIGLPGAMILHLPSVAYGFILIVAMRAGTVKRYYESAMAY